MSIQKLVDEPHLFDFYQAVYLLQRQLGKFGTEVGHDTLPSKEPIRFKVPQHLGFPGTPVERVDEGVNPQSGQSQADMYVSFMGLTGPSGVLPLHYSELVLQRLKQKDVTMREFFDLFNHRLISLYYRAWEKYRLPIQHQKHVAGQRDPITDVLTSLTGASQDLEVMFGGLFAKQVRSAKGLKQILEALSGCQIMINEFVGRWLQLADDEQTALGSRVEPEGQHARLGCSATLGRRVWDVSSAIDVEFQISSREQAEALMPGGSVLSLLKKITEKYLPGSTKVRWRMHAKYRDLPTANLGKRGPGLGQGGALMMRSSYLDLETSITIA